MIWWMVGLMLDVMDMIWFDGRFDARCDGYDMMDGRFDARCDGYDMIWW